MKKLKRMVVRRALVMEFGGFRPPPDPAFSWFARVNMARPGEGWPEHGGERMLPLCQLNLGSLPFKPEGLEAFALITVFVSAVEAPNGSPNGTNWCLRAYESLDGLVQLPPPHVLPIKSFPMRAEEVEKDYPCRQDLPVRVPERAEDRYEDFFPNVRGFKIGGWPSLLCSKIRWAAEGEHPAAPEYLFQIDTLPKAGWYWGNYGVAYFGRGTAEGQEDAWVLSWQTPASSHP